MAVEIGYGPLWRIDGPPPDAPLYGLLQAAEAPAGGVRIVPDLETVSGIPRWINGAEVYPYPPDPGYIWRACQTDSPPTEKTFGADVAHPQFESMTAVLDETCKTYKVWDVDEFKARAVASFVAVESAMVAKEFLTGEKLPLNPYLSDGNGTFPNGNTVTSAIMGLALLEKEIARSHRQGLIHCSPQIATLLRERFAIDNKTGVIRTINGTVIIPDFGYADGATPATTTDNGSHPAPSGFQEWMYATGPVDVRRDMIEVTPNTPAEAIDRGTPGSATDGRPNTYTYRVERYYLVDWDTELQAAVLVDPCTDDCTP